MEIINLNYLTIFGHPFQLDDVIVTQTQFKMFILRQRIDRRLEKVIFQTTQTRDPNPCSPRPRYRLFAVHNSSKLMTFHCVNIPFRLSQDLLFQCKGRTPSHVNHSSCVLTIYLELILSTMLHCPFTYLLLRPCRLPKTVQ